MYHMLYSDKYIREDGEYQGIRNNPPHLARTPDNWSDILITKSKYL